MLKTAFLPQETQFTAFLSRKPEDTHFEDKILDQVSFGEFDTTCASLVDTMGDNVDDQDIQC